MKKYISFVYFVMTFCLTTMADDSEFELQIYPLAPQSPTASSLARQIDYNVGTYTGIPDISIPLYTIQAGTISVPITLSYHASGITTSQEATNVGLGWNLNVGGMISRTVKCGDDFGENDNPLGLYNGYFNTANIKNMNDIMPDYCIWGELIQDSEPDIFYYSLPNHSGKFVFAKTTNGVTPVLFNKQKDNVKIEFTSLNLPTKDFIVTDLDGTRYFLTKREQTRVFTDNNALGNNQDIIYPATGTNGNIFNNVPMDFVSSWYLDKIVSSYGDTVYFNYDNESYQLPAQESCINITLIGADGFKNSSEFSPKKGTHYSVSKTCIKSFRLISIEWKHGSVRFDYDDREDVLSCSMYGQYDSPAKLSKIIVQNNDGDSIKSIRFNYDYFNSDYNGSSNLAHLYKRLKLTGITDELIDNFNYAFDYVAGVLPPKNTHKKDYWGYYNGMDYGSTYYSYANYDNRYYSGAKKYSNFSKAIIGTLYSVEEPLGKETRFEYEPNKYSYDSLIVSKRHFTLQSFKGNHSLDTYSVYEDYPEADTVIFSLNKETDVCVSMFYDYLGSKNLTNGDDVGKIPTLVVRELNGGPSSLHNVYLVPFGQGEHEASSSTRLRLTPGTYMFYTYHYIPDLAIEAQISYDTVSTVRLVNGESGGIRIKRIEGEQTIDYTYNDGVRMIDPCYSYTIHVSEYKLAQDRGLGGTADYLVQLSECTCPLSTLNGGNIFGYTEVTEHFIDGTSRTYTYSNQKEENAPKPYMPSAINYTNGLLERIEYKDSLEDEKEIVDYAYVSQFSPDTVFAFYYGGHGDTPVLYQYNVRWPRLTYVKKLTKSDNNLYTNEERRMYYNNDCLLSKETATIMNDSICKLYKYATDFNDSISEEMVTRNMKRALLEILLVKNNNVIKGKQIKYELRNGMIVPKSESIIQTSSLLSQNTYENGFVPKINYANYTNSGHPMQMSTQDQTSVYLWSYKDTYPIAEIKNATFEQVSNILGNTFITNLTAQESPSDYEITCIRNLRNILQNVEVSTYTYKPLVGMTSQTLTNGLTTEYEYDGFGRLSSIKRDSNILQKFYYNYKNR